MSKPRIKVENGHPARTIVTAPSPPVLKAFISAPDSANTETLRHALSARGIASFELDELDPKGRSIGELLEEGLGRADLVVAILSGTDSNDHVAFELGYALAMRKRILVFAPMDGGGAMGNIPFHLKGSSFLHVYSDDRNAIDFWLDRILETPGLLGPKPAGPIRGTKPLGGVADELLEELRAPGSFRAEEYYKDLVRRAVESSEVREIYATSGRSTTRHRADIVVWSGDFEPWLGNPVLIEVKGPLLGQAMLLAGSRQLASMLLERTRDGWGLLLVHGEGLNPSDPRLRDSRVLVLTIESFLESLRDRSLGEVLLELRNLRVHGKG